MKTRDAVDPVPDDSAGYVTVSVEKNAAETLLGHSFDSNSDQDAQRVSDGIDSGELIFALGYAESTSRFNTPFDGIGEDKIVISRNKSSNAVSVVEGGNVRRVTQENNDGSGKDTLFDLGNTHPYGELDISIDATNKVTGVQFKLDNDNTTRSTNGSLVDLSVIGQVFGSSIGRILAPDNQFGQLLGNTVGGLIGQKLAQNFVASLSFDASKATNADFATFSGLDVASAAAGSVASFLIAEIGTKLGLQGYGAQLFNSGAGAFTGSILNTVIQKGGLHVLAQEATWATAFATAEGAVGGVVGGILAQNLVHAESKEGAVGGQLLGAVGSALGMSFVALQAITGLLNFVIPGVGSFFGTILGTMLGDAIAGDPGAPKAFHDVQILGSDDHFTGRLVGTDDHGNAEVSRKMSAEVVTIANKFLDSIDGAGIFYPGKLMIGYSDGAGPHDYIAGWFPNGTEVAPRFTDPNDAIQEGVRELLMQTQVIGGNLLAKRAQQAFIAGSHPDPYSEPSNFKDLIGLSGDLRTAQDYEIYLNNREAINALMAANPESAFTAGWIATFARVNDLGLNRVSGSDLLGGLVGFLDSVSKAGLGAAAANATVSYGGGSIMIVEVRIANGTEVPGSLSVFADHVSQRSDASGTTVQFVFNNGLGGNSHDILLRGDADDGISAGDGFDFIDGGAGNDSIGGDAGNDILRGGKGWDYLRGGAGNDTYVFNRGDGADLIYDDYRFMELDSAGSNGAPGQGGGGSHEVHPDGGTDSLVFGPGIAVSDVTVKLVLAANGIDQNLIVGVRDAAHAGVPADQLADRIEIRNWNDPKDRIETFVFADGTARDVGAALGASQVPFGAALSGRTVAENSAVGTKVGTVAGFDFLDGAALTYSLDGSAGGRFAINASTGVVTVAAAIDYEASHSHEITVRTADQYGNVFVKPFTIAVTDVYEAPTGATLSSSSVEENSANGTAIGTVTGSDPDPTAVLSYALTDDAGGRFSINATTGVVTVANGALLDYESATSHVIKVRTSDQQNHFFDKSFTIAVTDFFDPSATSSVFAPLDFKLAAFAPGAGGWGSDDTYPRQLADVNGDGMADIVGFGDAGVSVSLATGGGAFGPQSFKLATFGAGKRRALRRSRGKSRHASRVSLPAFLALEPNARRGRVACILQHCA